MLTLKKSDWWAMLGVALLLTAGFGSGCGDDEPPAPKGPASEALSAEAPVLSGEALALTKDNVGVRLYWDELTLLSSADLAFTTATTKFGSAVIMSQVIDERSALRASPMSVQMNPAAHQSPARLRALFGEVDDVLAAKGAEDWASYLLVFDLFRHSEDWLVRWDGVNINSYEGEGTYGLWRDDMRDELSQTIISAIAEAKGTSHNVTSVVIGHGMERLILINPADYANFLSFYKSLRGQIKAQWPDLQVAAGLNWDRLMEEVAVAYAADGVVDNLGWGERREAWRDFAEPLYSESDFIALSSSPNPELFNGSVDNIPDTYYALLAELQGDKVVSWYSVNWPVTSASEKNIQHDFFQRFLELNAGITIDFFAWQALMNLGPSECAQLTAVKARPSECNAGIFSDSLAPTKLSQEFDALE